MTTSNHLEFATEQLAHSYMPYLDEEGESLTLEGFQQHVADNITGLHEGGVRHSDDAYALAYFLTMQENATDIADNWETIVANATKLRVWEDQVEKRWEKLS